MIWSIYKLLNVTNVQAGAYLHSSDYDGCVIRIILQFVVLNYLAVISCEPIHIAAKNGYNEVLLTLIAWGATGNERGYYGGRSVAG